MHIASHPDLPFSIEMDSIGNRFVRRNLNGNLESATATDYLVALLYSRLTPQEQDMGQIVSEHSKEVAALKQELAEAYKLIEELKAQLGETPETAEEVKPKSKR